MPRLLFAATALTLGVAPLSAAGDDSAKAKAVVEKAIKAAGWGADVPVVMTWNDKGTCSAGGMSVSFTGEWALAAPDK